VIRGLRLGVVVALMLVGASVDAIDLWRPIDGTSRELYRECDEGGIARNFARDGMHFLYPQIDWRGDGPGYVEMELPLYPYIIAAGYRVFGIHEQIGRVISYGLGLATLLIFIGLASYLLPPPGAIVASVFFALDPLTVRISNAIQAEPLMLFAYVAAVYAYIRWLDDDSWVSYGLALVMTSLAVFAKAPAVHLGFVFVFLTLWRHGWRPFRRLRLWAFAIAALVPPALWYIHARGYWLTYGNSLGASNHQHVVGLAAFTHLHYIAGIADLEVAFAWVGAGLIAVVLALALGPRPKYFGYGLLWYAAVFLYYLIIAGTSADPWGAYYHIVSVPPVALLIGGAAAVAAERLARPSGIGSPVMIVGVVLAAIAVVQLAHPGAGLLAIACAAIATVAVLVWRRSAAAAGTAALVVLTASGPILAARQDIRDVHPHRFATWYATARQFAPLIPPGVTIAVSGNYCVSASESAYNSPWYLYWTDHKGFTPCIQDHTMPVIRSLMARGARYFIAERTALTVQRGFEDEMRRTFPVVSETPVAVLFQLRTPLAPDSASSGGPGRYR
jgi:4-amino-4-deoxy-L-arabinose transferase-like glycosyltransferase